MCRVHTTNNRMELRVYLADGDVGFNKDLCLEKTQKEEKKKKREKKTRTITDSE